MEINKRPILSICIPTYNRSKFLQSCLNSIFSQLTDDLDVEILISDNKSTDNTKTVVTPYLQDERFRYFEQNENIGATKNFLKLVESYATGEFCWIVGDDDFLIQGALGAVFSIIKENKLSVDYFYASVSGLSVEEYNDYEGLFDTTQYEKLPKILQLDYEKIDSFEELISPKYSIIFLGELMASIFRRDLWLLHKINAEAENLETLETTYPHSVILAHTFFGKRAIYIKTPLLLALDGAREWWPKVGYIIIEQVKNLLDLYKELGLPKDILNECYRTYLAISFKYYFSFLFKRKSAYREKISFSRYANFLITNPKLTISFFAEKAKNVISKRIRSKKNAAVI
jgi:glycosyltransferase involved in cell wall biosynthesis